MFQVTTLETEIGFHLSRERLITALGLFFAALAALLAGVGIFGLAAQTVTRRMKEIGIRMALGAKASQVAGGIVNEVLVVVGVGIVFGAPLVFYGAAATNVCLRRCGDRSGSIRSRYRHDLDCRTCGYIRSRAARSERKPDRHFAP